MDAVLSGLVVLLIFLLATFNLSARFFSAQDDVQAAWKVMQARLDVQSHTQLALVSAEITNNGEVAELIYRNTGSIRLTDFDQWDVIVQYYTEDAAAYRIGWMPLNTGGALANTWQVNAIYQDVDRLLSESYEQNILNPGESIKLKLHLSPAVGHGQLLLAQIATGNGANQSAQTRRNVPPVLVNNIGISLTSRTSADIVQTQLSASDVDNTADELVYTITTLPAQGELSLFSPFTQSQINEGLLHYTHTGDGDDSFTFTINDGEDLIGSYMFNITINNATPILVSNITINAPLGMPTMINSAALSVDDVDDTAAELTYHLISTPLFGTLSVGSTFTQADIDAGLVTYNRVSIGFDTFQFEVSDGEATIGPYLFSITTP